MEKGKTLEVESKFFGHFYKISTVVRVRRVIAWSNNGELRLSLKRLYFLYNLSCLWAAIVVEYTNSSLKEIIESRL